MFGLISLSQPLIHYREVVIYVLNPHLESLKVFISYLKHICTSFIKSATHQWYIHNAFPIRILQLNPLLGILRMYAQILFTIYECVISLQEYVFYNRI